MPIGIAVAALALRLLPRFPGRRRGRLDLGGAVLVTGSLMIAVYAIVNGNERRLALRRRRSGCSAVAAVLMAAFVWVETRVERAARAARHLRAAEHLGVERRRHPLGRGDVRALLPVGAIPAAILGYSPLEVGLAFLPANIIMGVFSLGISAKLVMRFGIQPPLVAGLLLGAGGLLLFARAPVDGTT